MELTTSLIVFAAVVLAVIAKGWWKPNQTVGLPLAYVLSLAMIHWLGALIHTFPWYGGGDTGYVILGFEQCTYGVLAFGAGSMLAAPWILKQIPRRNSYVDPAVQARLPMIFVGFGVLFFTVLGRLLRSVPSFSAVAACGVYLVVAGLCLLCWRAWQSKRKGVFFLWLIPVAALPFITTATMGFMGYGVAATFMVFCFVFRFYRPRWLAAVGTLGILFLGLSLGVTYFRERTEIRAAVWGGEGYMERMERMGKIFTEFEFFDIHNQEHLQRIEDRLNQNDLVGRAISNLNNSDEFARGQTLWQAVLALVPRIIWPGKPVRAGSGDIVSQYTGLTFGEGTSVGVGQVMEFYINFGTSGVVGGFLVIGILLGLFDGMAARRLNQGDFAGFATWFLPGLGFLQTGGSLSEVTGTVAASVVLMVTMNKFILPGFFNLQTQRQWVGARRRAPARCAPLKRSFVRRRKVTND
jgi:hypothetical protein